ncbi:hypothetical protein MPSEU_000331500 [Mayamaea pseudoterrestris]|nr:hypothetical protein MPSEU_000331500 [Mayamaea pseudoterrestris]
MMAAARQRARPLNPLRILNLVLLVEMLVVRRAAAFSIQSFSIRRCAAARCVTFAPSSLRQSHLHRDQEKRQSARLFCSSSNSVTGIAYTAKHDDEDAPVVTLFTKEGCTLCDKVKDVLIDLQQSHPHSLQLQDITDDDATDWYAKYKYDIPVLHLNGKYWIKHRLTVEQAVRGLADGRIGKFTSPVGEPNASRLERT